MKIFPYSAFFFILFYLIPASAKYVEVDLNIPKAFKNLETKSVFVVTSYSKADKNFDPSSIISPTILELNKHILPISLYGRNCGGGISQSIFVKQVHEVLPIGTRLNPIRFFAVMEDANWFEQQIFKLFHNTSLRKALPVRGGPGKYYVVQDAKDQQMTLRYSLSYLGDIKGLGVREAEEVLRTFKNNNKEYQDISLIPETYNEYFEKCNYGGVYNSQDPSHDPQRVINEIKKMKSIHYFQNETLHGNKIKVTVDYLALAYLIWRSHFLRVRDIVFQH